MIDFGFDKMALIGAVALIVIGPQKLPRVARTVGHFLGKAQRYVADVKAEVNRSIELEELQKMKNSVEDAARDVHQSIHQTTAEIQAGWDTSNNSESNHDYHAGLTPFPTVTLRSKKNWRARRSATPAWYKQRHQVRTRVQSGAARVARFRPPRASA
jgi:sec-independent protein translocase protein TatB